MLFLILAAHVVLSGTQPVGATLVEAVEGGLLKVKTDKGLVTVRLLGMECGPVLASDKCIRSGELACFNEAVRGRKALARVKALLEGQSLLVTPCMSFEADKQKRTYGFIQWGDEKDLTSVLINEGLCRKLPTGCSRPTR